MNKTIWETIDNENFIYHSSTTANIKDKDISGSLYYKVSDKCISLTGDSKTDSIISKFNENNEYVDIYIFLNNCELPHYQRHRMKRNGHIYNPHSTIMKEYKDKIFNKLYDGLPIIEGVCKLNTLIGVKPPSGLNKAMRKICLEGLFEPLATPDFDNYMKFICDTIQGDILIKDDIQINSGTLTKKFSESPFLELHLMGYMKSWKNI